MKIVACCKIVPDEQEIQVLVNKELSLEKAAWKIGQYDLNAMEAGKTLAAETGGTLFALSVGGEALENTKIRKDILSRGIDELSMVIDNSIPVGDSLATAKVIAKAIAEMGDVDVVLCGTGSSDVYAQTVGIQVGTILDLPVVNHVTGISKQENGTLKVERTLEDVVEVLEVTLPAVLSVTSDINLPAIPGMKDILKAGKKPMNTLTTSGEGILASTEVVSQLAPEEADRRKIVVEGDGEDQVGELVQFLKKEVL